MVHRTIPADSLSGGCIIRDTATVEAARPSTGRKSVSVPQQVPGSITSHPSSSALLRNKESSSDFKPLLHKKMTGPMHHKEQCSRRKVISEDSQVQLANASFSSRISNTSLTGSCRRSAQRSSSVGCAPIASSPMPKTPFATGESPAPSSSAAANKNADKGIYTPRPTVKRVGQSWVRDSGNILADGSQNATPRSGGSENGSSIRPSSAPSGAAMTGRSRRAGSVGAVVGRTTDFTQKTSQVFDISTSLGKPKKKITAPGSRTEENSARAVFQQSAEQLHHRPAMRQRQNIKPAGVNELPMKARPSKRVSATTSIGAGAAAAAKTSDSSAATTTNGSGGGAGVVSTTPASRGRKMVENHTVSEESPRIVRIWAKSGRKPLDAPQREKASVGKKQFSRTESAPIAPTA